MRNILIIAGALILTVGGWLAYAHDRTPTSDATQSPARRAFLDPETGELAPPSAEQMRVQTDKSTDGLVTDLSTRVVEVIHRDGMTVITVPPSLWTEESVIIGQDGLHASAQEKRDD